MTLLSLRLTKSTVGALAWVETAGVPASDLVEVVGVTTLVGMRDDELIHPDTELAVHRYMSGAGREIAAVLERTRAALSLWGVTDTVALGGGTRSVVVSGVAGGVRVVVKVPLIGSAVDEAKVLSVIPTAPQVLSVIPTALLLEHIDGRVVHSSDGVLVAEALEAIAPMRGADTDAFMPWKVYLYDRVEEFAGRIIERSTNKDLVALAHQTLADLAKLTRPQPVVASHGDFQGKNLLATSSGVRVLDPAGILSPSAWEAAFSAMSVIANGGDPAPVFETAKRLGVGDVGEWLPVAAVAIVGSTTKAHNVESCVRVASALSEHGH